MIRNLYHGNPDNLDVHQMLCCNNNSSFDSGIVDAWSMPIQESCHSHLIISTVTADYHYPDWGYLVDFFSIRGCKIASMAWDWTHNLWSYQHFFFVGQHWCIHCFFFGFHHINYFILCDIFSVGSLIKRIGCVHWTCCWGRSRTCFYCLPWSTV